VNFWFDQQTQLARLPAGARRAPARNHLPEARAINGAYFAVPNTLQALQTLPVLRLPRAAPHGRLRVADHAGPQGRVRSASEN